MSIPCRADLVQDLVPPVVEDLVQDLAPPVVEDLAPPDGLLPPLLVADVVPPGESPPPLIAAGLVAVQPPRATLQPRHPHPPVAAARVGGGVSRDGLDGMEMKRASGAP